MQAIETDVSIVMPCLNEAQTVAECVARAREALAVLAERHGLAGEVLVADNGSSDGSREIAESAGARVVAVSERGYGAALIGGFRAARGRFLVMGDCDCSYDFLEAVAMVERLVEGADLCMGSRFSGEIRPGAMPWKNRHIGNPVLSSTLRLLFDSKVGDAHCGLRALTADCFARLHLSATGMEFASEMVIKAALRGVRIDEVPVTLHPDKRGRPPHLRPWRDGWRHLRYMLMLSPIWLFFLPAAALALPAMVVLAALLAGDGRAMVELGPFLIGNHWLVVASAMLILANQVMIFGAAATVYGIAEGYRRPGRLLGWLVRASRLEFWLIAGTALGAAGGIWAGIIVSGWAVSGFGALSALRDLTAAMMLLVIGAQVFFGGFLLSIIAGNRARLEPAILPEPGQAARE